MSGRRVTSSSSRASSHATDRCTARFDSPVRSHQRETVDWITSAKKLETRARRVEKAVAMLRSR